MSFVACHLFAPTGTGPTEAVQKLVWYGEGLRHGLIAAAPSGAKVSAIGLSPKRLIKSTNP